MARTDMLFKTRSTTWIRRSVWENARPSLLACHERAIGAATGTSRRAWGWRISSPRRPWCGPLPGYFSTGTTITAHGTQVVFHPSVRQLMCSIRSINSFLPFLLLTFFLLHLRPASRRLTRPPRLPLAPCTLTSRRRLFINGPLACKEASTRIGRLNWTISGLTPSMRTKVWTSILPGCLKANGQTRLFRNGASFRSGAGLDLLFPLPGPSTTP